MVGILRVIERRGGNGQVPLLYRLRQQSRAGREVRVARVDALSDFVPALKVLLELACPPLSVTVSSSVVPWSKATRPVGVRPYSGITVAVKVTDCPAMDGLMDETSVVVVLAGFTTWPTGADVLDCGAKPKPRSAVIACPTRRYGDR